MFTPYTGEVNPFKNDRSVLKLASVKKLNFRNAFGGAEHPALIKGQSTFSQQHIKFPASIPATVRNDAFFILKEL